MMKVALAILSGAALTGVGAGAVLNWLDAPPPAPPPDFKPQILLPYSGETSADRAWKGRAGSSDGGGVVAYVPHGSGVSVQRGRAGAASGYEKPVRVTPYSMGQRGAAASARQRHGSKKGDTTVKIPLR